MTDDLTEAPEVEPAPGEPEPEDGTAPESSEDPPTAEVPED